jgi:glycosyltransferase involved in cell wall biosynthesis
MNLIVNSSPTFSIITAALNGAAHLECCLQSVASQKNVDLEHIVIDGGSSDGSADILRRWSNRLAYWCSEPDSGISEAMNKGLQHARGTWLLFLHADDELLGDDALSRIAAFLADTSASIVGFPIMFGSAENRRKLTPRGGDARLYFKTGFFHQATFVRRHVFVEIGSYDTKLRIAMDYEFFLRAWLRGVPMATFPAPVPSWMRDTGVSSRLDWPSLRQRFAEERVVHEMTADSFWKRLVYRVYWSLYLPFRRMRSLKRGVSVVIS